MKPILVHGLTLNYILRTYFTIPMRAVKTDESKGSDSICRISRPRVDIPLRPLHYGDVIMGAIASQIISLMVVYSTVYSDADKRKHHSSASLAFVRGIHHGPVNSTHKWPVTRKVFPFDDVIINGRLSNRGLTSLIKEATGRYSFRCSFSTSWLWTVHKGYAYHMETVRVWFERWKTWLWE